MQFTTTFFQITSILLYRWILLFSSNNSIFLEKSAFLQQKCTLIFNLFDTKGFIQNICKTFLSTSFLYTLPLIHSVYDVSVSVKFPLSVRIVMSGFLLNGDSSCSTIIFCISFNALLHHLSFH